MPAKDAYHDVVVRALIKDGWTILRQHYPFRIGQKRVWIDLSVAKGSSSHPTLVEVKDFDNSTSVELLRDAFGQYMLYRAVLKYVQMSHIPLYLAIPNAAYLGVFSTPIGRLVVDEALMNLVVFDPEREVIERWQPFETSSEK